MNTMLASSQASIRRAASALGYSDQVVERFLRPENEYAFSVTANGKTYKAYRIQHSSKLGPYKGGIRFHHAVSHDEVQALATLMSLKTAAVGLPLGGGKGGVAVDPRTLSAVELEEISRSYARQLAPYSGSTTDIPAPDVNTNSQVMDWMVDEYQKAVGKKDPGAYTGKSIPAGGSEGRQAATGHGAVVVLVEYLRANNLQDKPLTLALQGFGNAGYFFAKTLQDMCPHVRLVAIANSKHTWVNDAGFDVTRTLKLAALPRPEDLTGTHAAITFAPHAILSQKVDILALAALEDAITEQNAGEVSARVVLELANGPVTERAEELLAQKDVTVLPDVIANAGGVTVSCLEWQQNLANEHWGEQHVLDTMSTVLKKATGAMLKRAKERRVTYRQAAFEIALQRLLG